MSPTFAPRTCSSTDFKRYVVVVLPLVPVTPRTVRSRPGWPNQLAERAARAALGADTVIQGPGSPGGTAQTTAAAPSSMAWEINRCPSVL